jgi:CHAT domain-containing protein
MELTMERMALVVGDYAATSGLRPLPMATKEGEALKGRYPHKWLSATQYDLSLLFHNRLVSDSGDRLPVQVVHMACHGEVDAANPKYNGIVIADNGRRIGPETVRGSELGEVSEPFVFLNACQLGTVGSDLLGDYGGMAGAFLKEGARGFVAPLWSVKDGLAHDIALRFYELALDDGLPVGEVMREVRKMFDSNAEAPSSTPLAYVFYGHPDLIIQKEG